MNQLSRTEIESQIAKCKNMLKSNDELIRWIWLNQNEHVQIFDCIKHLTGIDDHYESIIKELEKI